MAHADIIVPRGGDNKVAIQLIVQHVNTQLQLRGFKVRETLAHTELQNQPMPETLHLLPETPQVSSLNVLAYQLKFLIKFDRFRSKDFTLSFVTQIRHVMNSFSTRIV